MPASREMMGARPRWRFMVFPVLSHGLDAKGIARLARELDRHAGDLLSCGLSRDSAALLLNREQDVLGVPAALVQALLRKAWFFGGCDRAGRGGGYACPAHATRVGYGLRPARDGFEIAGQAYPPPRLHRRCLCGLRNEVRSRRR